MKKIITLVAIAAFVVSVTSASAFYPSGITVNNTNNAVVSNIVDTNALTGVNSALGGSATSVVNGGNVKVADDNNGAGNKTTTSGGMGGLVVTGEAAAVSVVDNTVNGNVVKVKDDCGCQQRAPKITVNNNNNAVLGNNVKATAKTGQNIANGGSATGVVTGGNVRVVDDGNHAGNTTKTTGGMGGEIYTGAADSSSGVVNVVNGNMVRIKRGGYVLP